MLENIHGSPGKVIDFVVIKRIGILLYNTFDGNVVHGNFQHCSSEDFRVLASSEYS